MVGWMKVSGCISHGALRARVVSELRRRGIYDETWYDTPRKQRSAAEALTRAEDWFELHSRGDESLKVRINIRRVRRQLEDTQNL